MNKKLINKLLFIILTSALGCAHVNAETSELVGKPAPECKLQNFKDGKPIKLSDYHNKVVYLDFWASWCGPCAQSMPFMNDLGKQLKGRGLEVIAVNLDEAREDAQAFLAKRPVDITIATDAGGDCPVNFKIETMPTSFIIDREGKVKEVHRGFQASDVKVVRQQLEALLKGK